VDVSGKLDITVAFPGKEFQYAFSRRLDGPQGQSGCFREKKNLLFLPGFEPLTIPLISKLLY
jgi:hypothetical protein